MKVCSVVCSAASVRGTRVLSAAGVSSPRSHSVDPVYRVEDAAVRERTLPNRPTTRFHDEQLGRQQRGLRRPTRERGDDTCGCAATTNWFRSAAVRVVGGRGRETRIQVLETSDVGFVERIAVKWRRDLNSEL